MVRDPLDETRQRFQRRGFGLNFHRSVEYHNDQRRDESLEYRAPRTKGLPLLGRKDTNNVGRSYADGACSGFKPIGSFESWSDALATR